MWWLREFDIILYYLFNVWSKAQFKCTTQHSFSLPLCSCVEIIQNKNSDVFVFFEGFSFHFSEIPIFDLEIKILWKNPNHCIINKVWNQIILSHTQLENPVLKKSWIFPMSILKNCIWILTWNSCFKHISGLNSFSLSVREKLRMKH